MAILFVHFVIYFSNMDVWPLMYYLDTILNSGLRKYFEKLLLSNIILDSMAINFWCHVIKERVAVYSHFIILFMINMFCIFTAE